MMKKIKIPRRDHEVYFIHVPEALKPKLIRSFAAAQMEKLHPGFSGETALDIKRLVLDKTRWVMATVMEEETLAEYRILHKGSAFFTNTSMAVHKKDFTQSGVQIVEDECIGFNSEKKTPVSIPLEPGKIAGYESPPWTGKPVPAKCRVFARRIPGWRVTVMIACALASLLFFLPAAKGVKGAKEPVIVPPGAAAAESAPESKYLPSALLPEAIEILADFCADLNLTGGKMTRWQYSEARYVEDKSPLAAIQTRGIDVISLREIFNKYEYVVLDDISDVRYIDGEPQLTIFLNAVREYLAPETGTFFSQSFSLPIFSDLTNELKQHGISVISETLPSSENGNALYTLTYTAKGRALARSMETISGICDKYPVRVNNMDISMSGENYIFTVVCSLVQSDAPRYAAMDDKKQIPLDSIPVAFGYKEIPPPPPARPKVVVAPAQVQEPQEREEPEQEIKSEVTIVGIIKDDKGQSLFYREEGNSKIMKKDTP